jgi:hypothetical protein
MMRIPNRCKQSIIGIPPQGFFDALSPTTGVLGSTYLANDWIYRGHGQADYLLLPSAFREGNRLFWAQRWYKTPRSKVMWQIEAEVHTLYAFMETVDRQGYRLPGESYSLRRYLKGLMQTIGMLDYRKETLDVWPHHDLFPLLALAQHYGLPTRLLDWTWDPYVAAYFAACSAVRSRRIRSDLCVWMLFRQTIEFEDSMAMREEGYSRLPVKLIIPPTADNPNLRAQRGLFLGFQEFDIPPDEDFIPRPYDQLVSGQRRILSQDVPFLFKLSMPVSEAPGLLRILSIHGVDGSTVFPGVEGAARAVLEREYWPDPDTWSKSQVDRAP